MTYPHLRNKNRPTDISVGLFGLWTFYFTDWISRSMILPEGWSNVSVTCEICPRFTPSKASGFNRTVPRGVKVLYWRNVSCPVAGRLFTVPSCQVSAGVPAATCTEAFSRFYLAALRSCFGPAGGCVRRRCPAPNQSTNRMPDSGLPLLE